MLGAGCLTPETGCLSFGTTATFNTTTKKYVELLSMIPPYPAAIPDTYYTEVMVYRGFWMVSWFKEEFGRLEKQIAEKNNIAPEKLFDALIEKIPPGSMGLVLQPYWSPGINTEPYAKGSIIGFGDVQTGPICIAPSLRVWFTPCGRAQNIPSGKRKRQSPSLGCRAGGHRAIWRCG